MSVHGDGRRAACAGESRGARRPMGLWAARSRRAFGTFGAIALGAFLAACSILPVEEVEDAPTLIAPPEARIVTHTVGRGFVSEEIRRLGRVAPVREEVLYFVEDGRVRRVEVASGDFVREGDVLVQLDVEASKQRLEIMEYDLEIARLRLERAKAEARVNPSMNPVDLRIQELEFEKLALQVERLRGEIERATLRAPFDGLVQGVSASVGQGVSAFSRVVTIADPSELEIHVELASEADFNRVGVGQAARVEVQGRWWPARIVHVPSLAERFAQGAQQDRRVRLRFEQDPGVRLEPGSLLNTVIVVREKEDALIVPAGAVRQFMGRTYVRLLDGEARREVDVVVGIEGDRMVEIAEGLAEGDVVILR